MDFLSLAQLNSLVENEIKTAFPDTYWVMAETSDVRYNRNGHCYLELIEKNKANQALIAKARAYIWHSTFQFLNPFFEAKTGQAFVSGLKILVQVSVDFHPLYGYGLNILDIDPAYTLGDIQKNRNEILAQLEREGIVSLNKELEMPLIPQRIALITSPTAAGYQDFINHLQNNKQGFVFYPVLFPAIMQGEQTEQSIVSALDSIYEDSDNFDVVAIIRGGGATSDLHSFDTYTLAANCAQFPLPIITGIGHERDDTVLDFVSHYRAKTPTAAADYLINRSDEFYSALEELKETMMDSSVHLLEYTQQSLNDIIQFLPAYSQSIIDKQEIYCSQLKDNIHKAVKQCISLQEHKVQVLDSFLKFNSPEYILQKGYSITLKNGKAIKSPQELLEGDCIETILSQGKLSSIVVRTK